MSEPQTLERASATAVQPHKGKYKQLTQPQIRELLSLRRLGKTQSEIAQILNCNQATVCRWLDNFTDTRDDATAFLRGNALKLARNIVKNGKPREHVDVLKGLNVLEQSTQDAKIQVVVGVSLPGLPQGLSPTVSADMHSLTADE